MLTAGMLVLVSAGAPALAGEVALTVKEDLGIARRREPITMGVPIPRGELRSAQNVRLIRDGKEVPAQFRAAGLWRPDESIRWLLVDLQTDIAANERQTYTLEYGPDVSQQAKPKTAIRIEEDESVYTVDTGTATFRLSKWAFSLFEEVRLADGTVVVARPTLELPRPGVEAAASRGAVVSGLQATVTRPIPAPKNTGQSHIIYVKNTDPARMADYTLRFTSDADYEVLRTDLPTLPVPPPNEDATPLSLRLFGGGETRAAVAVGTGAYLKDFASSDGAIAIPADAWLRYAQPRKGDVYTFRTIPTNASAASEGVFETAILEQGPLRSVIQVKGSFGRTSAPVLEYTARYHFYAGTGRVKVEFTLENNNHGGRTGTGNAANANIGGINCVFFDAMILTLPLAWGPEWRAAWGLAECGARTPVPVAESRGPVELYQDSNGGENWDKYKDPRYNPRPTSYVTLKGWRMFAGAGFEVEVAGNRANPGVCVSDDRKAVTVAVRDFWQNHPKSLWVTKDGTLNVGLFPDRYAGSFPLRSGEHKTHEVLFAFGEGGGARVGLDSTAAAAAARAFSDPLRLEPSPEWFARTRALGDLHPCDPERYGAYEVRNLSTIGIFPEGTRGGTSLLSQIEKFAFYGWMDYGDVPIDFESPSGQWGMKYDLDYQMAQQYARTLRPEWWQLFAAAGRHTADIDVHHQPHYPGLHYVKGGVWAHSLHNEPGHKNPHRNYNHFTKDLCFGARGTAAFHYLTGDWQAREACLEIAENALAPYMSPQADPGEPKANNRMGVRGDACTLNRLLEGYLLTGETKYLDRARWQVKACAFDGRPADHKPTSLWSSVFYMMALARYVEMFPADAAARSYLLAHLETLLKSADPETGIRYTITPHPDGSVTGEGQCSHYNIMAADALAIAYRLTGEMKYLEAARRCFEYGVKNACWVGGPATYFHIHSANGATHGNVFMAVDSAVR